MVRGITTPAVKPSSKPVNAKPTTAPSSGAGRWVPPPPSISATKSATTRKPAVPNPRAEAAQREEQRKALAEAREQSQLAQVARRNALLQEVCELKAWQRAPGIVLQGRKCTLYVPRAYPFHECSRQERERLCRTQKSESTQALRISSRHGHVLSARRIGSSIRDLQVAH